MNGRHAGSVAGARGFGARGVARRCSSVYVRHGGTACRVCYRLAYRSQRLDAPGQAHYRGMKLMVRLGYTGQEAWDAALDPDRTDKPKRMRWATYERIVAEAEAAEEACGASFMPAMERFLERVTRRRLV